MNLENGGDENDPITTVREVAERHARVRDNLEKAKQELQHKQKQLKIATQQSYAKGGELCVAEQNLRSLNEKLYFLQTQLKDKEALQEELLKECVDVEWKCKQAKEKLELITKQKEEYSVREAAFKSEVQAVELPFVAKNEEYEKLKAKINTLMDLKNQVQENKPEMKRLMSGEVLLEIEEHKRAIRDALCERDACSDMAYVEIDEKNEATDKIRVAMQIKEKHHKARLRKTQKYLQEILETEKHLKQTAEYLGKQVDQGKT